MRHRILAIDDDKDILRVLKANLELHDFQVDTAMDCRKAEDALSETLPDLILLDLMLPDRDGIEFCIELKGQYGNIPIIMLTARDRVSDKVIGLESGADDYMVKPFETLELIARIRACLRRYKGGNRDAVTCGEIKIDYDGRTVTVRGMPIELTPKEFDLLCLFIENRGKVLSRDIVRRSLWKSSRLYSWSRVIDVHIQHLRGKIEKNPSAPEYIHTIPGVGYKLVEPKIPGQSNPTEK